MRIQDYARNLRDSFPVWRLYVDGFPSWISQENTWPIDYGIPVSFNEVDKASEIKEGIIVIQFNQDEMLPIVRRFLNKWFEGAYEVETGKSRSWQEMKFEARFVDSNNVEPNINLTIKFPNSCDYVNTPPSLRAVYYI